MREIGLNRVSGVGLLGEVFAHLQGEVVGQDILSRIFEPDIDGECMANANGPWNFIQQAFRI